MSADNYYAIIKCLDGRYRGWMGFVSDSTPILALMTLQPDFNCATLEEAIDAAQAEYTEYGFRVVNEADLK
jgi:hypothetical protein